MKKIGWILLVGSMAILALGMIGGVTLAQGVTPEAETPTQEEAAPSLNGRGNFRGMGRWGGFGRDMDSTPWLENLAKALGITVERLEQARDQARATTLADAVAAGEMTQAQADAMLARHALRDYINHRVIMATALGMSVDELEAALANGQTMNDLMTERGIDAETFQANAKTAYEAALQQAVADGVITQARADTLLSNGFSLFGRGGFPGECDGSGSHGSNRGGGRGGQGGQSRQGGQSGRGGRSSG